MKNKIKWIGPCGGLGNRLLGIGSILSLSKILGATFIFPWRVNHKFAADFFELFDEMLGIEIANSNAKSNTAAAIGTCGWNPITILQDINTSLGTTVSREEFLFHLIHALKSLRYSKVVESKLDSYFSMVDIKENIAIHIRRSDRIGHLRNAVTGFLKGDNRVSRLQTIKANGIVKAFQYSVLPRKIIIQLENRYLAKKLKGALNSLGSPSYTIYTDSRDELTEFEKTLIYHDISPSRYISSYCNLLEGGWKKTGFRNTLVQDDLVELLAMSRSSAILQNNPASTFSILSSIIGNIEILTTQPSHLFWRETESCFGNPPNSQVGWVD